MKSIPGYSIDENTRSQTVVVRPNDTQTLHFYNTPIGGVEIIKVNEDNHSERIPNTTFEIRKVDDALVDTVTTDKNGRVFVALEDGSYYAKEVTSNKSFRLDDTPHYFEIKDGKHVTLQVTNKKLSGIVIHKIDSVTGEGIYGVKFVLYDANKKPIGEYTSDDEGYIYIDEIPGGLSGRFYLRELEAAPGYTLDKQYKTVYVSPGKTVEIEWENTAVTGQIQIYKYAAEYNEVTGTAPGTPLKGAVYEIVNARSGKVVDYITTDARGVAASKPLPLTRYQLREVTAPAYWQLDPTVHDVTLEYPGQIIKLSAYLNVTINRAEMLSAIKRASAIAPADSPLDVLRGALLEADAAAGKLTVTSTNLEAALEEKLPCTVQEDGALVFGAKMLAEMLSRLPQDTVQLCRAENQGRMTLRSGDACYEVDVWERGAFPKPDLPFPEDTVKLSGIPAMAQHTVFATAQDNRKPLL